MDMGFMDSLLPLASPHRIASLMRLGWIAQQPVHGCCFGRIQGNVVLGRVLQVYEECFRAPQCVFVKLRAVLKPELVRELADKRAVFAAGTPDRYIGLAGEARTEVEQADVLKNFLNYGVADQMDLFFRGLSDSSQHRKQIDQSVHVTYVFPAHPDRTAGELDVVGVKQTNTAQLLFQRQGLDLELDAVIAEDVRPDVGLGCRLQFGMPELEDDLGLADGEAVFVGNPAAQDEGVVVEAEVIGINEQYFSDLDRLRYEPVSCILHAVCPRGLP